MRPYLQRRLKQADRDLDNAHKKVVIEAHEVSRS